MGPLELDRQSQTLEWILDSDAVIAARQHAFNAFFNALLTAKNPRQYLSFFEQFRGWLPMLSERSVKANCAPECHLTALKIVDHFIQYDEADPAADWPRIRRAYQCAAAWAYLCGGAIRRAAEVPEWPAPAAANEDDVSVSSDRLVSTKSADDGASLQAPAQMDPDSADGVTIASRLEQAERLLAAGVAAGDARADTLRPLITGWRECAAAAAGDSLRILLATRPCDQLNAEAAGVLTLLQLSAHPNQGNQDVVLVNNRLPSGDSSLYFALAGGVTAARSLFIAGHSAAPFFNFCFSFPGEETSFSGNSISLAAALLAYAAMMNHAAGTPHLQFRQNIAVTGSIAPDGRLLPVDDQTLKAKLTAAFFSPIDAVILPGQNLQQAGRILAGLQQHYPGRPLQLIPAAHFNELLEHSSLIMRGRIRNGSMRHFLSLPKVGLRAIAVLMVLLLMAAAYALLKPADREPRHVRIVQSKLAVSNAAGELLWTHDFGLVLNPDFYQDSLHFLPRLVKLADINRDGRQEILFGLRDIEKSALSGSIFCFSPSGQLLWQYKSGDAPTFTDIDETDHPMVQEIRLCEWKPDHLGIFVVSHYLKYPAVLTLLNTNGEREGEYWHAGHIVCLEFGDLDRDGVQEVLAGGYHNSTGEGMLAVLDPGKMAGVAPGHAHGQGFPPGTEKYYLRFPATVYAGHGSKDNISSITVTNESIHAVVANHYLASRSRAPSAEAIHYTFDFNLRLRSVLPNDYYRHAWYELRQEDFGESALEAAKSIRYWDGEEWTATPTMTRMWR